MLIGSSELCFCRPVTFLDHFCSDLCLVLVPTSEHHQNQQQREGLPGNSRKRSKMDSTCEGLQNHTKTTPTALNEEGRQRKRFASKREPKM